MYYEDFKDLNKYESDKNSRKRIMNSAIYHFATEGYVKSTTKGIALDAGVSEALVFKYYGNKQRLLEKVSQEILDQRIPALFDYRLKDIFNLVDGFTAENLKKIIKEKFRYVASSMGYVKIILLEMEHTSKESSQAYKEMIEGFFETVEGRISRLQKLGVIRKDIPPRTIFRAVAGILGTLLIDHNLLSDDLDIDMEIDMIVEMILKGVTR